MQTSAQSDEDTNGSGLISAKYLRVALVLTLRSIWYKDNTMAQGRHYLVRYAGVREIVFLTAGCLSRNEYPEVLLQRLIGNS